MSAAARPPLDTGAVHDLRALVYGALQMMRDSEAWSDDNALQLADRLLQKALDGADALAIAVSAHDTGGPPRLRAVDDDSAAPPAVPVVAATAPEERPRSMARVDDAAFVAGGRFSAPPLVLNRQASSADLVALAHARAGALVTLGNVLRTADDSYAGTAVAELLSGPAEDILVVLEELNERGSAAPRSA